jgi:hypothetical protein
MGKILGQIISAHQPSLQQEEVHLPQCQEVQECEYFSSSQLAAAVLKWCKGDRCGCCASVVLVAAFPKFISGGDP